MPISLTPATIVLIDDHSILREGVRALLELEPDLRVVGEAGNSAEGVALVRSRKPNLVIADLVIDGEPELQSLAKLRAVDQDVRVLVLTAHSNDEYLRTALRAGADGYVLKHATYRELLHAIRAILAGQKYFCPAMSSKLVAGYLSRNQLRAATAALPISQREREVMTGIALGESNKRLARSLCLSVKTVEKHRANLMRKLALHNTAAVTLFAVRNGFVPPHATDPVPGGESVFALPPRAVAATACLTEQSH